MAVLLIVYIPVSLEERRPAVAPWGQTRLFASSQAQAAPYRRCPALSAAVPPACGAVAPPGRFDQNLFLFLFFLPTYVIVREETFLALINS